MALFRKKEKVPNIPPAPKLPELPTSFSAEPLEKPQGLPSLPPSNFGENLNQEMVKSAVNDHSEEEGVGELPHDFDFPEPPNQYKQRELIPSIPTIHRPSNSFPPSPQLDNKIRTLEISPSTEPRTKSDEPVFVQITEFQEAQKDFQEIQKKVKELEKTLRRVKEIKLKEDEEISSWSQDIEKMKSRLTEIDSNIFSKI